VRIRSLGRECSKASAEQLTFWEVGGWKGVVPSWGHEIGGLQTTRILGRGSQVLAV